MSNVVVADTFTSVADMERFATAAVKSGIYKDVKDAASAMVRIQVGRELGLGAAASLKAIQLIQGTPTFSANFIAALIKKSRPRYNYRVKTLTATECTVDFYEDKEAVGVHQFTWDEAKKAGLTTKDVWVKYPKSMLFARCITAGARVHCPDLTVFPYYTHEELGGAFCEEDILEDEKQEKSYSSTSEVSLDDRYKLLTSCSKQGIQISKMCKHLGIQSFETMSEAEFNRAVQFANSYKGE